MITENREHPAFRVNEPNLHMIYQDKLDLHDMLRQLKEEYGCECITIQTGGTLNGLFLREKLFDYVDIVIAPDSGWRERDNNSDRWGSHTYTGLAFRFGDSGVGKCAAFEQFLYPNAV